MKSKWVTISIDGEVMEFEILVPYDMNEDEAFEYAVEYVLSTIQIEVR